MVTSRNRDASRIGIHSLPHRDLRLEPGTFKLDHCTWVTLKKRWLTYSDIRCVDKDSDWGIVLFYFEGRRDHICLRVQELKGCVSGAKLFFSGFLTLLDCFQVPLKKWKSPNMYHIIRDLTLVRGVIIIDGAVYIYMQYNGKESGLTLPVFT